MPAYPMRTPEPIIDYWSIDINRLNDIVCTIYIFITNYLNGHLLTCLIFLYEDRSHILIDILCQYSLYHYQVTTAVCCFHYAQIIHVSIPIQIQVRECGIWIIEQLFKLLKVFRLTEQRSYCLQIKVFRNVGRRGGNCYRLVCMQHPCRE